MFSGDVSGADPVSQKTPIFLTQLCVTEILQPKTFQLFGIFFQVILR